MSQDLYEGFRTAYPSYADTSLAFYRLMRIIHLLQQYGITKWTVLDYDRFILRYYDTYLPMADQAIHDQTIDDLPEPHTFFINLRDQGDENQCVVNDATMAQTLPEVSDITLPVLTTFRGACVSLSKITSPVLVPSHGACGSLAVEPAKCPPSSQLVFETTITVDHDNIAAIEAWMDWKDSDAARLDSADIQEADEQMYRLACEGNLEGVQRLIHQTSSDLMDTS